jgi:hypothetical protein
MLMTVYDARRQYRQDELMKMIGQWLNASEYAAIDKTGG